MYFLHNITSTFLPFQSLSSHDPRTVILYQINLQGQNYQANLRILPHSKRKIHNVYIMKQLSEKRTYLGFPADYSHLRYILITA